MPVSAEGRALGKFRAMARTLADLDGRLARVTEYRDRLVATRDRKHNQIPLSDREWTMWQNKIGLAEATLQTLQAERRALLEGSERETEQ